jgi:hypothetical protein
MAEVKRAVERELSRTALFPPSRYFRHLPAVRQLATADVCDSQSMGIAPLACSGSRLASGIGGPSAVLLIGHGNRLRVARTTEPVFARNRVNSRGLCETKC